MLLRRAARLGGKGPARPSAHARRRCARLSGAKLSHKSGPAELEKATTKGSVMWMRDGLEAAARGVEREARARIIGRVVGSGA